MLKSDLFLPLAEIVAKIPPFLSKNTRFFHPKYPLFLLLFPQVAKLNSQVAVFYSLLAVKFFDNILNYSPINFL